MAKKYVIMVPFTQYIEILVDDPNVTGDELLEIGAEQHDKYVGVEDPYRYSDLDFDQFEIMTEPDGNGNQVPVTVDV